MPGLCRKSGCLPIEMIYNSFSFDTQNANTSSVSCQSAHSAANILTLTTSGVPPLPPPRTYKRPPSRLLEPLHLRAVTGARKLPRASRTSRRGSVSIPKPSLSEAVVTLPPGRLQNLMSPLSYLYTGRRLVYMFNQGSAYLNSRHPSLFHLQS
jgi:hypothetical protein